MNQHFINFLIIKVRLAGGAPAQSGCFQHQQLRLSYVCTSATAAFAFDAFDAYGVSGFTRLCRSAIVYKAKQAENIMFSICEPKN
jgi:hypothetical protein